MTAPLILFLLLPVALGEQKRDVPKLFMDNETAPVRVRRFVHRHACIGIEDETDNGAPDTIGCAEESAAPFEHVLTPPMLWCNDRDCISAFNLTFPVHSIRCSPFNCTVLLHCADAFEQIKYASMLTLCGIVLLLAAPCYLSRIDFANLMARQRLRLQKNK